jgi:hypothetical protein
LDEKAARRRLAAQEWEARQRKLMKSLQGKSAIWGMIIGVVTGQVDELENVTISHAFRQATPGGKIKASRETNALATAVQPFDETAEPDYTLIPVPESRRQTAEMLAREQANYQAQIKLAIAYAAQEKDRLKKLAAARKKAAELEKAATE